MLNQKGFALVTVTLLGSIVFAGALSYMDVTISQTRMVRASQNMLEAQAAAEAGVEEVAWECSYNGASFSSADGWVDSGGTKTKTVNAWTSADGTTIGSYTTTVSNLGSGSPEIAVTGTSDANGGSNVVTLKALLTPDAQFTSSVQAEGNIRLSGNAYTDSYNSSEGAYGGSNRSNNGTAETNSGETDAIALLGNAQIRGDAGVGTGGAVDITGNASVTGTVSDGVSNVFTPNAVPSALSSLASSGNITLNGNNAQTITSGSYKYGSISTSANSSLTISGDVTLYLTGETSITNSGNSGIIITSGSSLTIYFDGSVSVSGNGFANNNGTSNPTSFQLYGTSTATSVSISGNGSTTGIISAPQANVVVTGNGDIYGSIIANTFTASGNGGFHYDEDLADNGPSSGYQLSWARRTA